jgi:hypothetical protein
MTLLFAEGFETVTDMTDMIARGLVQNASINNSNSGIGSMAYASRTGLPGKGWFMRGLYSTSTVYPLGGANYNDYGMLPFNQSVYSLWQSGGFAVGFSGSFNTLNFLEIAPGDSQQLAYDGSTYYWAITRNVSTGAWGVAYSTDLRNWTPTITTPSVNQCSTITVNGSGLNAVVIVASASNSNPIAAAYTTNMGLSWNNTNSSATYRTPVYLNGPTALYVSVMSANGVNTYPCYSTTWTGTPVQLSAVGLIAPVATTTGGYCKLANGYIIATVFSGGTSQYWPTAGCTSGIAWCLASADPTNAANWTRSPTLPFEFVDVTYFNGYFIAVGYDGIYYLNASNPTTWMPAQGVWNLISSVNFSVFAVNVNSNMIMAVGQDPVNTNIPAIYSSTDGVHWTKQNRMMVTAPSNGNWAACAFTTVFWDGARWIVTGGINNGMIITSPDGEAWEAVYITEAPESNVNTLSFMGVYTGTLNTATNIFTPWNAAGVTANISGLGVNPGAQTAAGTRTANLVGYFSSGGYSTYASPVVAAPLVPLGQWPGSSNTHYYELVYTAVAGTPNAFTVQLFIDGQNVGFTSPTWQIAPAADTTGTTQVFFNLNRNGNFVMVDDIYLTNFAADAAGNVGRLGPSSFFSLQGKTVVQGQFNNTIGADTNLQTVNTELSNAEGYLYATTRNTEDIYSTSNTMPSNYLPKAILLDAYLGSQGQGPQVAGAVGLVSGSATQQGTPVAGGGGVGYGWANRATLLTTIDPNTSAPFTLAGVNALEISITKTT